VGKGGREVGGMLGAGEMGSVGGKEGRWLSTFLDSQAMR